MIPGGNVGLAPETFQLANTFAHTQSRRMEGRDRQKLEASLQELLQTEGEIKRQEKDLATKVCDAAGRPESDRSKPCSPSKCTLLQTHSLNICQDSLNLACCPPLLSSFPSIHLPLSLSAALPPSLPSLPPCLPPLPPFIHPSIHPSLPFPCQAEYNREQRARISRGQRPYLVRDITRKARNRRRDRGGSGLGDSYIGRGSTRRSKRETAGGEGDGEGEGEEEGQR